MPVYTFRLPARFASTPVTVYNTADVVQTSGTTDSNALFTASLATGDYYAKISYGYTSYRAAGEVDRGDLDNLSEASLRVGYNPTTNTYGVTDDSFRNLRGAVSRARAGTGDIRIAALGDSITFGQNVASANTNHYLAYAARSLASRLGLGSARGPIPITGALGGAAAPEVTIGAGWTTNLGAGNWTVGYKTAALGTATSVDIAFTETVDGANVLWQTGGGNTGGLVYSWDGGTKTTVTNPGGGYAMTNTYIAAPSRGTHVLNLWVAATGFPSYYFAAEGQDSTIRKVRWYANGVSGKTSTELAAVFGAPTAVNPPGVLNAIQADLLLVAIGENDQMQVGGAVTTATYVANLETIRARVAGLSKKMDLAVLAPPNSSTEATFTPRMDSFMSAAQAWSDGNGVPILRLDKRWKDWATVSASAFAYYSSGGSGPDPIHPSERGTPDMGELVGKVLAAAV